MFTVMLLFYEFAYGAVIIVWLQNRMLELTTQAQFMSINKYKTKAVDIDNHRN